IIVADPGRWEAGRQGAGSNDMFVGDLVRFGVEISEVAAADIDRAHAEARLASIDAIEIDQPLECRAQWRIVVIARLVGAGRRPDDRRRHARHKEVRRAEKYGVHGARLIDQLTLHVVELDAPEVRYAERRRGDHLPEFAQRIDATLRRIAGDDRRIDGADRDS